jgi:hypothetical protein
MTERKQKMAELRGDGLSRLDQGLIGSIEARGAEQLGKKHLYIYICVCVRACVRRYTNHNCISQTVRINHGDECILPLLTRTSSIFGELFLFVRNV